MSERIKGETQNRPWQNWQKLIKQWYPVVHRGKRDPYTVIAPFTHLVDWLEEDGMDGHYFIEFNGDQLVFKFENPKAALNFKIRWG
jgi:hypothetical protein